MLYAIIVYRLWAQKPQEYESLLEARALAFSSAVELVEGSGAILTPKPKPYTLNPNYILNPSYNLHTQVFWAFK